MAPWSTLQFQTYTASGKSFAQLPVGYFAIFWTTTYSATGAADYYNGPYTTAQAGLSVLTFVSPAASTLLNQAAAQITQSGWMHFQVTNPGTYQFLQNSGTVTGWTSSSGAITIVAMPVGENTFLQSRDHVLRSLAQARFREDSRVETQVSKAVKAELRRHGLESEEKKENKYDALIRAAPF